MPEICRFLGIVIYMLYDDHRPPHFHAEYGEYKVTIEIQSGVVQGRFPRRALKSLLGGTNCTEITCWKIGNSLNDMNP